MNLAVDGADVLVSFHDVIWADSGDTKDVGVRQPSEGNSSDT